MSEAPVIVASDNFSSRGAPLPAYIINHNAIAPSLNRYFQPDHIAALVVWLTHQDTQVTNETWQVSAGRAGRMTFAAYPAVRTHESSPEHWASRADELLRDGALQPMGSTAAMFMDELLDANPELRQSLLASGDLGSKLVKDH